MRTRANTLDLSGYRQSGYSAKTRVAIAPVGLLGAIAMDGIRPKPTVIATIAEAVIAPLPQNEAAKKLQWRWVGMGMIASSLALSTVIVANIYLDQTTTLKPAASTTLEATALQKVNQQALAGQAKVRQALAVAIGTSPVSAVVTNLKTGQTSSLNGGQQMVSASLYKLYVAMAVYKQIDAGDLALTSKVTGSGLSVASCLQAMITVSDNRCGVALGKLVGWERQNPELRSLGFISTSLSTNSDQLTSADDVALFYKMLYSGTLLSPASSSQFLDLLKSQRINNRLPASLPSGTVVAHKTGDLEGLVHDAGIVYSPNGDYIISLMSGPWNNSSNAAPILANVNAGVYAAINTPAQP